MHTESEQAAIDWVLRQPNPRDVLEQLYACTLQREKMSRGRSIRPLPMPAGLEPGEPIVQRYAGDAGGWDKLCRGLRDAHPELDLFDLYRRMNVRAVQNAQRRRAIAAVAWLQAAQPYLTTEERARWRKAVEQSWMRRRAEILKAARKRNKGTISLDYQEQLLEAFWTTVDDEIASGKLPRFEQLTGGAW